MDISNPVSKRARKREFWRRHLERQAASGLSQMAYCQMEGLKVATLQYWKRRLSRRHARPDQLRFVPLELGTASQVEDVTTMDATMGGSAGPSQTVVTAEAVTPSWIRLYVEGFVLEFPETVCIRRLRELVSGLCGSGTHVAH